MRFKREMKGPPTGKELDKAMPCHTLYGMKMTMHIDEALLRRVMES